MFEYKKVKCGFCVTKNQIQVHKNCSVDDFNVYMIQTGLVTEENTTCANGATFFVILGPVQGRCVVELFISYVEGP